MLKRIFIFVLAPLPRGIPREGPDCHVSKEIVDCGPIPALIRGGILPLILILALSAAGIITRHAFEFGHRCVAVKAPPKVLVSQATT